jgi:hypothetical protein
MSTSLFGKDGHMYNQTAVFDSNHRLNRTNLAEIGLPRFTTTYAISQLCYNLSLGAAVVSVSLWYWNDLRRGEVSFYLGVIHASYIALSIRGSSFFERRWRRVQ